MMIYKYEYNLTGQVVRHVVLWLIKPLLLKGLIKKWH